MAPRRKRARLAAAAEDAAPATEAMHSSWQLSCCEGYGLRRAVTSYGFFMLPPNRLTPVRLSLSPQLSALRSR